MAFLETYQDFTLHTFLSSNLQMVCGLSLVCIAGSNTAEDMNVCLLWMLCVVQVEVSASDRSLVQGSPTVCVCVCVCVCVMLCDHVQQ